jgi:hypothetical protein
MINKFGKKIGMTLLGASLAVLLPMTASARDRDDDRRFDRDGRAFQQQRRAPVQVFNRRDEVARDRFIRDRSYERGYSNGYNNQYRYGAGYSNGNAGYSNGYYDSHGNWCSR